MFYMKGDNQYTDHFDFFKWSAPVYETPEEVVEALNQIDLKNKKIKEIRCIGNAEIAGVQPKRLYDAIQKAGIRPGEDWWLKYPHLLEMPIERKVILYEPVQFVFLDESTFEFMPMANGGARFSQNCIPLNITDGINMNNIDLTAFMGDHVKGNRIESCEMAVQRSEKVDYRYYKGKVKESYYPGIRTEYNYNFSLEYPYLIVFKKKWNGFFTLELDHISHDECDTIPYGKAKETMRPVRQIYITPGRDGGGTFWIEPECTDDRLYKNEHSIYGYDNCGMSVDTDHVEDFLMVYLYKHFDQNIQDTDRLIDGFDSYGDNLYSRESVVKIIEEIRETISLLQTDFDNPKLGEIKKYFTPSTFSPEINNNLSEEAKNKLYRENIDLAIDFYTRFSNRLESMLIEHPYCDVISFTGP